MCNLGPIFEIYDTASKTLRLAWKKIPGPLMGVIKDQLLIAEDLEDQDHVRLRSYSLAELGVKP